MTFTKKEEILILKSLNIILMKVDNNNFSNLDLHWDLNYAINKRGGTMK